MSYTAQPGDTPFNLAQRFLGNGNLWPQFSIFGVTSGTRDLTPGTIIELPSGGPARRPPAWGDANDYHPHTDPMADIHGDAAANSADYGNNAPGPVQDEINQVIGDIMKTTGYPTNINLQQLAYGLWKSGSYSDPNSAYAYIWNELGTDLQQSNPWAEYGMTKSDYADKLNKLKTAYTDLTGGEIPPELVKQAIQENWNTQQLTDTVKNQPEIAQSSPWISEGGSYKQAQEAYVSSYGTEPANQTTLASWWNFGRGAKQVKGGGQAAPQPNQAVEKAKKDTEVR